MGAIEDACKPLVAQLSQGRCTVTVAHPVVCPSSLSLLQANPRLIYGKELYLDMLQQRQITARR